MSIEYYDFHLRDGLGTVRASAGRTTITGALAGDEEFQGIVLGHLEFTYEKQYGKRVRLTSWDQIKKVTRPATNAKN